MGSGGGPPGALPASAVPAPLPSPCGPSRVDVVVLCGSAGSRLFPLTAEPGAPKCLLPLANQPVLAYLLASLATLGFAAVHLATTPEFHAPLLAFLALYPGPKPQGLSVFVAPPGCGGTADVLHAMRQGSAAAPDGPVPDATPLLQPSPPPPLLRGESVLVVPGECVAEGQLLDLLDLHQRQVRGRKVEPHLGGVAVCACVQARVLLRCRSPQCALFRAHCGRMH